MDILTLAQMNKLKKNGGAGYTTPLSASWIVPASADITSDVELLGGSFKWFSSITPTLEEFLAGTCTLTKDGKIIESYAMTAPILNTAVLLRATGAYAVRVCGAIYIVSSVTENEVGTLPKTGMYYSTHTIEESFADMAGAKITLDFGETIHTIDPKFIPGVVLPVVELSEVTINAAASNAGNLVDMTAAEVAFFVNALAAQTPCIAKATMSGISVAAVANLGYDPALLQSPCYLFNFVAGSLVVAIKGETAQIMYSQG